MSPSYGSHQRHGSRHSFHSQGSTGVPKGTGTAYYQSSLERKLELLEARFSQPLVQQSPSEATLQPLSSPNWGKYSHQSQPRQQHNQQSNSSQHSFGFDSPKTFHSHTSSNAANKSHRKLQSAVDQDTFLVRSRSKRNPSSTSPLKNPPTVSTLDQVRKAADRQMQKVAASQQFVVGSSSCSDVSSESTRLVRNCPPDGSPAAELGDGENPTLLSTPPPTDHSKKRKSIPMKIEDPSVKENNENNKTASARRRATGSHAQRKLATSTLRGQKKASTIAMNKLEQPYTTLKQQKTEEKAKSRPSMGEAHESSSRVSITPKQSKITSHVSPRPSASDGHTNNNSNENTSNKKASSLINNKSHRSVRNNSLIEDFFGLNKNRSSSEANAADRKHKRRKVVHQPSGDDKEWHDSNKHESSKSTKTTQASANSLTSPNASANQLHKRIQELEQTCRDQDEQLKAVANNRTILHTALQSALDQREKEITQLKEQREVWESRSRMCLEEFVRAEADRAARQVRERLAADGARLGRIVHTRTGIRSPVESWEEGHAIRNLQTQRAELRDRRKRAEERYQKAQNVAKQFREASKDGDVSSDTMESVGGIKIRSGMDAMEAVESARYHLENMRNQERELLSQEHTLNEEKGAHIRALKRVASEDASRFRSCPKLHDRYVLKCLLGKGGFSEVWRAFDLIDLREVAVKIHQLDPRWTEAKKENYTKHVSREYEIHKNARHPRIVSLMDVFEIDNNSFATVLELCKGTDLDTLLKEKRRLSERDARAILLQILSGMQYLSQPSDDGTRQGIIHYDLKPGNILFDEMGDAKITDFGLSKIVDTDPSESMELTSQGAGTYWYLPPECFVTDETVRISNKVDVWSIGVIFFQMLFGRRPFGDGQSQDGILANRTMLNARQVSFPDKPQVSDDCKAFIRKCLSYDQAFRPTIAQLCQQPYVTVSPRGTTSR